MDDGDVDEKHWCEDHEFGETSDDDSDDGSCSINVGANADSDIDAKESTHANAIPILKTQLKPMLMLWKHCSCLQVHGNAWWHVASKNTAFD